MSRLRVFAAIVALALFVTALAACAAAPAPRAPASAVSSAAPAAPAAQPVPAPGAQEKPAGQGATAAAGQVASLDLMGVTPYEANRKIIKNGEMRLMVADTDRAIDQVTQIAVDNGGYVIGSQTALQDGFKTATLNLGVPVERFEEVQRRLRNLALKVLNDTASGQDVTDEYVDLQSQLANQQATAARVREFLGQTKTVEEALKVNEQLSQIEGEIEKIKGRMNFLKDRSAYSTLQVNLEPQRPTPTPAPTATPVAWRPGQTFHRATDALGTLSRTLADAAIWMGVIFGPFVLLIAVLVLAWRQWRRSVRQSRATRQPPANG